MPGDLQVVSASRDRTIRIFDVASTFVFPLDTTVSNLIIWFPADTSYVPLLATQNGYAVLHRRTMANLSLVVRKIMCVDRALFLRYMLSII